MIILNGVPSSLSIKVKTHKSFWLGSFYSLVASFQFPHSLSPPVKYNALLTPQSKWTKIFFTNLSIDPIYCGLSVGTVGVVGLVPGLVGLVGLVGSVTGVVGVVGLVVGVVGVVGLVDGVVGLVGLVAGLVAGSVETFFFSY